jgi:hypothetical protein
MLPQAADCSAASMRPGGETAHHYFGGPDPDQPARGNHPILTLGNPGPVNGSSHLWPTRGHFQATPEPGRADQAGNRCTFMALHQQILRSARHDMTRFQGNDPLGQIRMICARAAVRQVYPLGANSAICRHAASEIESCAVTGAGLLLAREYPPNSVRLGGRGRAAAWLPRSGCSGHLPHPIGVRRIDGAWSSGHWRAIGAAEAAVQRPLLVAGHEPVEEDHHRPPGTWRSGGPVSRRADRAAQ